MSLQTANKVLSPCTKIYRFLNFFALADTLRHRQLRFASPSTFPDKNEGLEIFYNSLRAAVGSKDGSYTGIRSQETANRIHNTLQGSFYICSWTRAADSIPLWSLYSADRCGVRISTTVSKLQSTLNSFSHRYDLQSQSNCYINNNSSFLHVVDAMVRKVDYEDLRQLHEDILNIGTEHVLNKLQNEGMNFELFTLKDSAYAHEGEIRGIVRKGEVSISKSKNSLKDTAPWWDGDYIYVDIPEDFIETVSVDPRCPLYKREKIEEYLLIHKIPSVKSEAFGYLPDELDFISPKI